MRTPEASAGNGGAWPLVSVVVPIRNERRYIARCLRSILEQDYPTDRVEILIADGMSSDGTREIVASLQRSHPQIRMVDNSGGIVATGLNVILPLAAGQIIVRVDGHCELDREYVRRSVAHLRDTSLAAVGGPLTTIGETPLARAIAAAMSSRFGVGDSMFRVGSQTSRLVDTVAFPAYSRTAMKQAGPFDEELVRNQDDEYSYRLRGMGFGILLSPEVRAVYYSRGTIRSLWRQYFQYGYWKVRVMQKHPRQMSLRQFVPPLFVAALLTSATLSAIIPSGWTVLAAVAAPYLVANLAAAVVVAAGAGWRLLPVLPVTFAALHLSYGSGFLLGLVTFAHRWRDRAVPVIPRSSAGRGTQREAWL